VNLAFALALALSLVYLYIPKLITALTIEIKLVLK
tara:strand:+ start:5562 stop:5666 length:105 start_codon:yes stop_codon:yes gene_type:complete